MPNRIWFWFFGTIIAFYKLWSETSKVKIHRLIPELGELKDSMSQRCGPFSNCFSVDLISQLIGFYSSHLSSRIIRKDSETKGEQCEIAFTSRCVKRWWGAVTAINFPSTARSTFIIHYSIFALKWLFHVEPDSLCSLVPATKELFVIERYRAITARRFIYISCNRQQKFRSTFLMGFGACWNAIQYPEWKSRFRSVITHESVEVRNKLRNGALITRPGRFGRVNQEVVGGQSCSELDSDELAVAFLM